MDARHIDFPQLALQTYAPTPAKRRNASALRALMDLYELSDDFDDEENERELMVQLSGMVGGREPDAE